MENGRRALSASSLSNNEVKNPKGKVLGNIKDLMIDVKTGQVVYAVLSFGGFLGIADKLFAIPWKVLELDTFDESFVLDMSEEKLKEAPGFDKDHWPDMGDQEWGSGVHAFYNYTPYWEDQSFS